jgi:predicted transcriptional regulator
MNQGEALRRIRVSKGLSQENVASILSINQTSYSEWGYKEFIKEEKPTKILSALGATREEFNKMADELNPKNTNGGENLMKIF